jgi:RNA-binding protein
LITAFTSRHFVCSVELDIFIGNRMDPAKIKQLKTQAHLLKPVIIIGQSGLTEAVQQEIEITLNTHELIKIKIRADRDERNQIREQILSQSKAELIQSIGQVIVIFRKKPAPKETKNTGPRRR